MSRVERFLEALLAGIGLVAAIFGLGLILVVGVQVLGPWGSGGLFDVFVGGLAVLIALSAGIISLYMVMEDVTWAKVSVWAEDMIMFPFLRFIPGWVWAWTRFHYGTSNLGRHGTWALPAYARAAPKEAKDG